MAQGRPSRQPAQPPQPPMSGGPGDEPELPPQEPSPDPSPPQETPAGTVIRIGNREFTVDPELASEFEAHRREVDRKFSQQGRELGEMRAWRQQVESTLHPQQASQPFNYDTAIFERPRETLERFGQEIEHRLSQRYEQAETQRRNWERFYRDNPDLAEDDRLVKSIAWDLMQSDRWRFSDDLPGFFGDLARESRQELLRISRKVKESGDGGSRGRTVESGGTRRTEAPSPPPQPKTISDMLLEKQQKRRAVAE